MGGKVLRVLLSSTGYPLYTLVVLVGLLWLLFPAEAVQARLEQELQKHYPGYDWKIGSLGLALPDGLVLTDVQIAPMEGKDVILTFDRVTVAPVAESLFSKDKAIHFTLHLLQGDIRGRVLLSSSSKQFTFRGTFEGLQPATLEVVQQRLQRKLDGTLAGTFSGKGKWNSVLQAQLQGKLRLTGGTLQFKEPVLGLNALPYKEIKTDFKRQDGQWLFEQGTLQSPMINGTFSGSIQTAGTLGSSRLQFTGALTPRSEMFAGLKNTQLAEVVRTHLKGDGLPFTVNGTAAEPGIRFSGELARALKGLKRSAK